MTFTLERRASELVFRTARLAARTEVAPGYLRLRFEGDELHGFDSPGADDHIRIFPLPPSSDASVEELRGTPSREYTPLAWDGSAGWLDLEFVIHGDTGIAAPWARDAAIGSIVAVGGPRGSMVRVGSPDSWFLAGDETAVPAIRRLIAEAGPDASGTALIEVADAAHEIPIETPGNVGVVAVHRGGRPAGSALADRLDALTGSDRPGHDPFVFIAAEQSIVRHGRALLERWDIPTDRAVVKGYWKRDTAEYHAPH